MKRCNRDDGYRLSDELWERIEPLLPAPKPHPLGCHRPRVANRAAMDGTGICSCSAAYRRFREWIDGGVFEMFWRLGLLEYDELQCLDWGWLVLDGAMTKAPLGGEKNRPQPMRPRQRGRQAQHAD